MRPRRIVLLAAAAAAGAAVAAQAVPARADGTGTYPRRDAPFVLRTELDLMFFSTAKTDAFAALTAGYSFVQWLALEATAGLGVGNGNVAGDTGGHFMLAGRVAGSVSANHRHALTAAAGPLLVSGGGYGRFALVHGEAGYEYRRATGVALLLVAGLDVLLDDSAVPARSASCGGLFDSCPAQLHRGDAGAHLRVGVGFSF